MSTSTQTINVLPAPTLSITVNDASICDGGTALLTAVVSGGTISNYQWQQLVGGNWTNVGTNQSTYTTPALTTGTYTYRVIGNPGTSCVVVSPNSVVTVVADPTISISSTGLNICDGGTTTFTATVSGGNGTTVYQWQQLISSVWTNVGTNSNVFTTPILTVGTYTYRLLVTQDAGCAAQSANQVVNVFADPTVGVSANNPTVCVGGSAIITATVSGGSGTNTFQWQSSPDNSVWTNVGTNSNTYTTPILNTVGTTYYRVLVTQNPGCSVLSTAATVTVVPDVTITTQPTDITECVGGTNQMTVSASGGTGLFNYQWQSSPTGTGSWTNVGTGITYTPPSSTPGTTFYRVIISASGNGCGPAVSNNATATIIADLSFSTQPNNINECVGGTDQMTVTVTGGVGTISYQWQSSLDGTSGWTNVGTNSTTYTPPSSTPGTTYYRVLANATGSGCGQAVSNTATATINALLTITSQPTGFTECVGGTNTMTATVTGGAGTFSYQWQSSPDGSSGWVNAAGTGSTSAVFTPPSTTAGTTYYRVIIGASGSGCNQVVSNAAAVIIVPTSLSLPNHLMSMNVLVGQIRCQLLLPAVQGPLQVNGNKVMMVPITGLIPQDLVVIRIRIHPPVQHQGLLITECWQWRVPAVVIKQ